MELKLPLSIKTISLAGFGYIFSVFELFGKLIPDRLTFIVSVSVTETKMTILTYHLLLSQYKGKPLFHCTVLNDCYQ